jgi:hypothetical protein
MFWPVFIRLDRRDALFLKYCLLTGLLGQWLHKTLYRISRSSVWNRTRYFLNKSGTYRWAIVFSPLVCISDWYRKLSLWTEIKMFRTLIYKNNKYCHMYGLGARGSVVGWGFTLLLHVLVTYKTGFELDDWIYCTLYVHTVRSYRQLQRYRYSTHFPAHRCTRPRILRLH